MMQFVILRHDLPTSRPKSSHIDLMFENGDGLETWSTATWPPIGDAIDASPLPIHRKAYLEYEGPVSGGRGSVQRLDRGEYTRLESTSNHRVIRIDGERWQGMIQLNQRGEEAWLISFASDNERR